MAYYLLLLVFILFAGSNMFRLGSLSYIPLAFTLLPLSVIYPGIRQYYLLFDSALSSFFLQGSRGITGGWSRASSGGEHQLPLTKLSLLLCLPLVQVFIIDPKGENIANTICIDKLLHLYIYIGTRYRPFISVSNHRRPRSLANPRVSIHRSTPSPHHLSAHTPFHLLVSSLWAEPPISDRRHTDRIEKSAQVALEDSLRITAVCLLE